MSRYPSPQFGKHRQNIEKYADKADEQGETHPVVRVVDVEPSVRVPSYKTVDLIREVAKHNPSCHNQVGQYLPRISHGRHSTSNKCPHCAGIGLKIRNRPTDLYRCGFVTEGYTCPECLGTGRTMPVSLQHDGKSAAAGGER